MENRDLTEDKVTFDAAYAIQKHKVSWATEVVPLSID